MDIPDILPPDSPGSIFIWSEHRGSDDRSLYKKLAREVRIEDEKCRDAFLRGLAFAKGIRAFLRRLHDLPELQAALDGLAYWDHTDPVPGDTIEFSTDRPQWWTSDMLLYIPVPE